MPYFHISTNPEIKRLMPRHIGMSNGMREEEKNAPDFGAKVICSAKSIAACIALLSPYQEKHLAVYLCEDDGAWYQASYSHPEAPFEWRRQRPCGVIFLGWVIRKGAKYNALRRCADASDKARTIAKHEKDFELDRALIFERTWIKKEYPRPTQQYLKG